MHLTVSRLTDEELTRGDFLPKVLRESMADGMIVNYTHDIPTEMLGLIHAHHAPAVWLNAKLGEDCVYPDDVGAARTATEHLIKLGHRKIAFLHLISSIFGETFQQAKAKFHYSVLDRAQGYASVMLDAGLTPRIVSHDRFVETGHIETCRDLLSGIDRPTAVLVYSDRDVSALMCAAAELRLMIPRDLSVLVFHPGDEWIAGRHISVVDLPTREMGRHAVAMLMRKLEFPNEICAPEAVPYGVTDHQTLASPAD
jgi:DNA-binding LacI/PurR family transcriptional regulator